MAMQSWMAAFRSRLDRASATRRRRLERAAPATMQQLEQRTLLTTAVQFFANELIVFSDADETITLRTDPTTSGRVQLLIDNAVDQSLPNIQASSVTSIQIFGGSGENVIDLSGVTAADFTSLTSIVVDAGNGNDTVTGSLDLPSNLSGGHGRDLITGGTADDTIDGNDGNDTIFAGLGSDLIDAGDGNDEVHGEDGNDTIDAGDGADTVNGDVGDDSINGGDGNDTLMGDDGDDQIHGDHGNDVIEAGQGDDRAFGGADDDQINGDTGNDVVFGGGGNDILNGFDGDDRVEGGTGNDTIDGGFGDDFLKGDHDDDSVDGSDGNDIIYGGAGNDRLIGDGENIQVLFNGNDRIKGQGGNDTLIGTRGADTLEGGAGNDLVRSTVESSMNVTPPAPPVPPVPPVAPPPVSSAFDDAVAPVGGAVLGTSATLSTGTGDGSIQVTVDGDGDLSTIIFDPVGPQTAFDLVFTPEQFDIAIDGGNLQALNSANATLTGTTTSVMSSFTQSGLNFSVVQQVEPFQNALTSSVGGMVTQTFTVMNSGAAAVTLDFVRTTHYHVDAFNDTGARIVDNGVEILLQAGGPATLSTLVDFLGITSLQGTPQVTNRFEVSNNTNPAPPFSDAVFNDPDGDGFANAPDHAGLGLRSSFSIAAGGTITFTRHLFAASAAAVPNVSPVANPDMASTFDSPVTIDLVSNDSDVDGAVDFSTIQIVTAPANGTVVDLGDGRVVYTPNPLFSGTDTFSYTITDNDGAVSNVATVTIMVVASDGLGDRLEGGTGNDTLIGSSGDDLLAGDHDDDELHGGRGNDTLRGGAGNDTLFGEEGNDQLRGQGGTDLLDGGADEDDLQWNGAGNDTLLGGTGADSANIDAGGGTQNLTIGANIEGQLTLMNGGATLTIDDSVSYVTLSGGSGNDTLTVGDLSSVGPIVLVVEGGRGNDRIDASAMIPGQVRVRLSGGDGVDNIRGSAFNDTISGGNGNDVINAGAGNDTVFGEAGLDVINGDAGNDIIDGGEDNDVVNGGDGNDTLNGGFGNDTVEGEDGDDSIFGSFGDDILTGSFGNDTISGGSGADFIRGGAGDDFIDGGRNDDTINANGGHDTIDGNHGNDSILGGAGDDEIVGGDGDDTIKGEDGVDSIAGNDGHDFLNGDGGDDLIVGGDGDDTLRGGAQNDTLIGNQGADSINGNGDNSGQPNREIAVPGEGGDPTPKDVDLIQTEEEAFTPELLAILELLDGKP